MRQQGKQPRPAHGAPSAAPRRAGPPRWRCAARPPLPHPRGHPRRPTCPAAGAAGTCGDRGRPAGGSRAGHGAAGPGACACRPRAGAARNPPAGPQPPPPSRAPAVAPQHVAAVVARHAAEALIHIDERHVRLRAVGDHDALLRRSEGSEGRGRQHAQLSCKRAAAPTAGAQQRGQRTGCKRLHAMQQCSANPAPWRRPWLAPSERAAPAPSG